MGKVFAESSMQELSSYSLVSREYAVGRSRFDFLLESENSRCLVEVKSVTHVEQGVAMFPDAPTSRGARHLHHLQELNGEGFSTAVVFVVQRSDAVAFAPYSSIDPHFAQALKAAQRHGVRIIAYSCLVDEGGVTLHRALPVRL
jgi:sugar fermentation stimulation protein A